MEERPQYVTDALEMAGIDLSAPKRIVQEVSGFTPMFDCVIEKYKDETRAAVHGAMWRYCQMEDGVCKASLSTIGERLGVSPATVMRHAEELCKDGYFIDLTPDLRNKPHVYADTGKVTMKSRLDAHISQRNVTVSQRNATVSESQLNKDIKKDSKETRLAPESLAEIEKQANKTVDAILRVALSPKAIQDAVAKFFLLTPTWEGNKFNRQWMQWAMENDVTPAQVEFAANLWRSDKRFNWQPPSLKGIQEHWLELRGDKVSQSRDIETDSAGAPITF